MFTSAAWHRRFTQQARWTLDLRQNLYTRLGLEHAHRVLEVGCGTGAVSASLPDYTRGEVFGIDLNLAHLSFARGHDRIVHYAGANALSLPFPARAFDVTLCHFLLLWLPDPAAALAEMARVTRPGGFVIALAEPDYAARIDHPPSLVELGRLQRESLRAQGAEPDRGRQLAGILAGAGLRAITTGILSGQWNGPPPEPDWQAEWTVLEDDLRGRVDPAHLSALREQDRLAWEQGERVLFVPTFYGWGTVPSG